MQKRDFYADVREGTVPDYDILITNPPYSGDHKEKIIKFCVESRRPWALLMPNYVYNKAYFQDQVATLSSGGGAGGHNRFRHYSLMAGLVAGLMAGLWMAPIT